MYPSTTCTEFVTILRPGRWLSSLASAQVVVPALRPMAEPGLTNDSASRAMDAFFLDDEKVVWDWPDVTGRTYDPTDLARTADGSLRKRPLDTRWQRDVVAFLESGDATIRTRHATGYSSAAKRDIDSGAVLFRDGRFVIHATHGA